MYGVNSNCYNQMNERERERTTVYRSDILGQGNWLRLYAGELRHDVVASTFGEISTQVGQSTNLHLALRFLCFGTHVREERCLWEVEEPRVDMWFVWVDV